MYGYYIIIVMYKTRFDVTAVVVFATYNIIRCKRG